MRVQLSDPKSTSIKARGQNLNRRRYRPCEKCLNFGYSLELHHSSKSQTIVGGVILHHHCACPRLANSLPLSAGVYLAKKLRPLRLVTPPILIQEYKGKHQSRGACIMNSEHYLQDFARAQLPTPFADLLYGRLGKRIA